MAGEDNSRRENRRRERRSRDRDRRADLWPVRPRGTERKTDVSRRPRRRRRRVTPEQGYLSRVLSALVICVTILAALIMFFRVKIVDINGAHRYSDAEILSVAGISDGKNMFLLNKYKMVDRLLSELNYLEDAHISRKLPDTLIIDLKECVIPMAVIQDDVCWLISPSGRIVDRLDASSAGHYAQITGCPILSPSVGTQIALPRENAAQQRSLVQLLTALDDAQMLGDVDGIRLDKPSFLLMDYGGRFTVKLPLNADYAFKLRALEAYIAEEKIQDNMTGTFDITRDDKSFFQQNVR